LLLRHGSQCHRTPTVNFLAHAYLAGDGGALRAGSAAGDFFRGPLAAGLPAPFARGVLFHRAIDGFAERHPAFVRSRRRFRAPLRRWGGVITDLYYDHLLAQQWQRHHALPLADFSRGVYADLAACASLLAPEARRACASMAREDWFGRYASLSGLAETLARMAARVRRDNPLAGAEAPLLADADGFAADFAEFIADARGFAAQWLSTGATAARTNDHRELS
jgi:acyl carrier protein phosphodiesterase